MLGWWSADLQLVLALKSKISRCNFKWVPRSENNHVDSLANLEAAIEFQYGQEIRVEHIANPSVQRPIGKVFCLDTLSGWRDPIITYLKDGSLPDDKADAQKLLHLTTKYTLLGDILYKKSYSKLHVDPYLRCLGLDKTREVMQEIHGGYCRKHSGGRSLAHKVINQGYYWLKIFNDAKNYVKKCSQCQRFAPASNRPSTDLHTL